MGKELLFVDDEFSPDSELAFGSYMSYYEVALCDAGFVVTRANNCDEAIAIASDNRFDLAILDVMMPPGLCFQNADTKKGLVTGLFLARQLRELDSAMHIFFLSNAGGDASLFEQILQQGVVDRVLFKLEVKPSDLVSAVLEHFRENESA